VPLDSRAGSSAGNDRGHRTPFSRFLATSSSSSCVWRKHVASASDSRSTSVKTPDVCIIQPLGRCVLAVQPTIPTAADTWMDCPHTSRRPASSGSDSMAFAQDTLGLAVATTLEVNLQIGDARLSPRRSPCCHPGANACHRVLTQSFDSRSQASTRWTNKHTTDFLARTVRHSLNARRYQPAHSVSHWQSRVTGSNPLRLTRDPSAVPAAWRSSVRRTFRDAPSLLPGSR
jgi:hypothetical protein